MNPQNELAIQDDRLAPVAPSVGAMLQAALDKGVTSENVAVMEKLMDLYERDQARQAERAFSEAFVRVQCQLPKIEAVKPVPDKFGNTKYYYAPLEEIMPKVMPVLRANGFAISFDSEIKDDRAVLRCTLTHLGGHHRTNISMAKIGSGPPGATPAQADGSAATYAKRRALCDALAIVSEIDNDGAGDARNEGSPITTEQAIYLKELVAETKSDEAAFLKFAGAPTYAEIGSERYDRLVAALNKKAKST